MTVYSFGDSFTVGLGTDREYEESLLLKHPSWDIMSDQEKNIHRKKVNKFRERNCFTYFFANSLNIKYENLGFIGCNNNYILDLICSYVIGNQITKNDLVLINFTSSLRNTPSFFPHFFVNRPERGITGISFGNTEYSFDKFPEYGEIETEKTIWKKYQGRVDGYRHYLNDYKNIFLKRSFSFDAIDYYNQNLILFLQDFLKAFKIKYIMFDAFDPMVNTDVFNFTEYIDKNTYWGYGKDTIWSFLDKKNDSSLLETYDEGDDLKRKLHPSKKGHQLFAHELYKKYQEIYGTSIL